MLPLLPLLLLLLLLLLLPILTRRAHVSLRSKLGAVLVLQCLLLRFTSIAAVEPCRIAQARIAAGTARL